jgi:ABC-type Fe3+/spermidine/putrescine transport system ATPase subunit
MEGILLSDRIAVMNGGRILQLGKPDEVYERPDSQFVADFMGSTNLLRGILRKEVGAAALEVVQTDLGPLLCSFAAALASGSRVVISVRPENIKSRRMAHPTKTISWKAESKNGLITSAWSSMRSTCSVSSCA